jgi:hypothetical protein
MLCCRLLRFFLTIAYHIFTTSPNYKLYKACRDEGHAFEVCLVYYYICALAIPSIGSHLGLNRLRAQLTKEVPCMENFRLKLPPRLRQPIVPAGEAKKNGGGGRYRRDRGGTMGEEEGSTFRPRGGRPRASHSGAVPHGRAQQDAAMGGKG